MIDAHAHVWRIGRNGCSWPPPALAPIHRDHDLEDFRHAAAELPQGVILVQSQESPADTAWLLGLEDPLIRGVVGWTDLEDARAAGTIGSLAASSKLRGLRPMVQERESEWYDRLRDDAVEAMIAQALVLEALVRPRHLESLERLARRFPRLGIVVDHAAKPDFRDLEGWSRPIEALALRPNVYCKLSGLLTELRGDAGMARLPAVFDVLWRSFGPERLIWGSDWPVLNLAADYDKWLRIARNLVPGEHREQVFGGNARRVYRL